MYAYSHAGVGLYGGTGYDTWTHKISSTVLLFLSYLLVLFTFPLSLMFCFKVVKEYERAVSLVNHIRFGDAN